jgi:choline-glycine betaine transporter
VFWIAAVLSAAFVVWGILATESLAAVFDAVLWSFLVPNFGWVFILSSFGFLAFAVYLAFSRYGKVRLGGQDERPEFSTVSWVAMMFSAGMGIGLMFFGVAEPLSHMGAPPFGLADPNTKGAAQVAMQYTYFHWAFHPWAIYAIMGLALAYFTFRKGMPNLISTAFYPLLGDRVYGPIGKTIDILAIFATLFGSATSLGLGALQINQGLNAVFGSAVGRPWGSRSWLSPCLRSLLSFRRSAACTGASSGSPTPTWCSPCSCSSSCSCWDRRCSSSTPSPSRSAPTSPTSSR